MSGIASKGLATRGLSFLGLGSYGLSGGQYEGVLVPPVFSELVQLLKGGVEEGTDNVVNDKLTLVDPAEYAGNNTRSFNGSDQYVTGGTDYHIMGASSFRITLYDLDIEAGEVSRSIGGRYQFTTPDRSYVVGLSSGGVLQLTTSATGGSGPSVCSSGIKVDGVPYRRVIVEKVGSVCSFQFNDDEPIIGTGPVVEDLFGGIAPYVELANSDGTNAIEARCSRITVERLADSALDTILLGGQSGMVGSSGSLAPVNLQAPQDHLFTVKANSAEEVAIGLQPPPTALSSWSLELQMGNLIAKKSSFVKSAVGGTSMAVDWQKGGNQYDNLEERRELATATTIRIGYYEVLRIFGFYQGEEDAKTQVNAEAWGSGFEQMISDMESDGIINSDTPIVLVRIHKDIKPSTFPYASIVRAEQERMTAKYPTRITLVSIDDLTMIADETHLDSDSLVELGNRVHSVYAQMNLAYSDLLVSDHAFDDGFGDVCYDAALVGADAAYVGSPAITTQDTNATHLVEGFTRAYVFNGTDSKAVSAGGVDYSLFSWSMPLSFRVDAIASDQDLVSQQDGTGAGRSWLRIASGGTLRTYIGGSSIGTGLIIQANTSYTGMLSYDQTEQEVVIVLNDVTYGPYSALMESCDGPVNIGTAKNDTLWFSGYIALAGVDGYFKLSNATFANTDEVLIRALEDGSNDAWGMGLTNPPNATHNDAESLILETDLVNGDLLARAIFSNDGIVFDARSMAEFQAFISGNDNVWIKWHPTECRILEIAVYDIAFIPTLDQYNALVRYFEQGSCGGGVVPFPDMLNFTYDENQQNIPIIL